MSDTAYCDDPILLVSGNSVSIGPLLRDAARSGWEAFNPYFNVVYTNEFRIRAPKSKNGYLAYMRFTANGDLTYTEKPCLRKNRRARHGGTLPANEADFMDPEEQAEIPNKAICEYIGGPLDGQTGLLTLDDEGVPKDDALSHHLYNADKPADGLTEGEVTMFAVYKWDGQPTSSKTKFPFKATYVESLTPETWMEKYEQPS